jgi:hypothetical protein
LKNGIEGQALLVKLDDWKNVAVLPETLSSNNILLVVSKNCETGIGKDEQTHCSLSALNHPYNLPLAVAMTSKRV